MKTILVDDNQICLEILETVCSDYKELEIIGCYTDPQLALREAQAYDLELAVLDIDMPGMDGVELGVKLRELHPDILLFYLSSHPELYADAVRIKADWIMMKPIEKDLVKDMIDRAFLLSKRQKKPVRARMLGRFEVFVKDRPLPITNAKAKELLALCLDHQGGVVTMDEACTVLWEMRLYDEQTKQLYRKAVGSLRKALREVGVSKFFIANRASCHIDLNQVECDYYDYLKNPAPEGYDGEYLYEYDWAEVTHAQLMKKKADKG